MNPKFRGFLFMSLAILAIFFMFREPEGAAKLSPNTRKLFAKPLIVGASLSADVGTPSPGQVLASWAGSASKVTKVAFSGAPAFFTVPQLTAGDWSGRSVAVALDLFFWDGVARSCQPSFQALQKFFASAEKAGVPIVIGNVPRIARVGKQPCRDAINATLAKTCETPGSNCHLLDLDSEYAEILKNGLKIDGHKYSRRELMPDGLHLSKIASRYLAGRIAELVN